MKLVFVVNRRGFPLCLCGIGPLAGTTTELTSAKTMNQKLVGLLDEGSACHKFSSCTGKYNIHVNMLQALSVI